MKVTHTEEVQRIVGKEKMGILQTIFDDSMGFPPGTGANRFRADHPAWMDDLDQLSNDGFFLKRIHERDSYRISAFALPLLDSSRANLLLDCMEMAYVILQKHYREKLKEPIQGESLVKAIVRDESVVLEALYYMRDVDGWWSGIGNDFPRGPTQYVTVNEEVLRHDSFAAFLSRMYQWNFINPRERIANPLPPKNLVSRGRNAGSMIVNEKGLTPEWLSQLDDGKKALVEEIESALQGGLVALPVMGLRTLIETIMVEHIGVEGGFISKLKKFKEADHITGQHLDLLRKVLDAGHATSHRAYFPADEDVRTCVEVVKHLLQGIYVLNPKVKRLADSTPPDPRSKS